MCNCCIYALLTDMSKVNSLWMIADVFMIVRTVGDIALDYIL